MASPTIRTAISFLAVLASFSGSQLSAEDATVQQFGDWTVTIQPGLRGSGAREQRELMRTRSVHLASQTAPAERTADDAQETTAGSSQSEAEGMPGVVSRAANEDASNPRDLVGLYSQVYNRIPFNRVEYMANPGYRHDSTMEILFGKMRPTVIHRAAAERRASPSASPAYYRPAYSPYGFNSYNYPFYYRYLGSGWLQPASLW